MIKKIGFLVVLAAIIAAIGGCQKEELTVRQLTDEEVQPQVVVQPDVYVENGYLAFKNIEAVDSIILLLNKMTTSEKETWENQMGIKSARAEFDALFEKYDELPTYEAFLAFKEKYKDKLKFNENDPNDCSIDYPYVTDYFTPVLNNKGLVKIGKSLIKYTKSEHFVIKNGNINALSNLEENVKKGDVFVYSKLSLKSSAYDYAERDLIHEFPEDNPFPPYPYSPWHEKTDSRKLKNQLRIDRFRNYEYNPVTSQYDWVLGYKVYFKQQAQKKSWGKWRDYNTTYIYDDLLLKVGNEPIWEFNPTTPPVSQEIKPHVELNLYGYVYREPEFPNYVPPLLPTPTISFSILTSCRGFGVDALYRVDYIEHSGFPGSGVPFNPVPSY